ncbi:MAG TPA: TetR/AcrR family transcriptional regulator [Methylocella sp.]|nr:TetR/AcrR family transcriptional regulator [Methylocella sp.]
MSDDTRPKGPVSREADKPQKEEQSKGNDTRGLIIKVGTNLFREIGFPKTTVNDIARRMHMSSANVYRFFHSRAEICDAICANILSSVETRGQEIAACHDAATQKLIDLVRFIEATHYHRYRSDRNLHDLLEAAITENWPAIRQHTETMLAVFEHIVSAGIRSGEFREGNPTVDARILRIAFLRFCDPRLVVEYKHQREPTIDQMVDFCVNGICAVS